VPNALWAWKSFWTHPTVLLVYVGQVELVLVCLEIVLISAQDRCTICVECTTSMEIILGTLVLLVTRFKLKLV
jgi:hypothetical protein